MTDTATLATRLSEAEAALHEVSIGRQVSLVDYEGRRVGYTAANADGLRAYIADLKSQLYAADPSTYAGMARRFPRVTFG